MQHSLDVNKNISQFQLNCKSLSISLIEKTYIKINDRIKGYKGGSYNGYSDL